uniref:Integrase catalytic domain-containing protein n=1 Tax=Caenorhabditis tropicalis TaxID=1561998 RepID=A0A1I7U681_9PELO
MSTAGRKKDEQAGSKCLTRCLDRPNEVESETLNNEHASNCSQTVDMGSFTESVMKNERRAGMLFGQGFSNSVQTVTVLLNSDYRKYPKMTKAKKTHSDLRGIKGRITKELTKARTLVALIERDLAAQRSTMGALALMDYHLQLEDQLTLLEGLPMYAEEMIEGRKHLCSPKKIDANLADVEQHFESRGFGQLVERLRTLIKEVDNTRRSAEEQEVSRGKPPTGGTGAKKAEAGRVKEDVEKEARDESERSPSPTMENPEVRTGPSPSNPLNRDSSTSSHEIAEFADLLSRRLSSMEQTQQLLLETCDVFRKTMQGVQVQLERHEERWVKLDERLSSNEDKRKWRCSSFDEKTGRPIFSRFEDEGDSVHSVTNSPRRVEKEYSSPKQAEVIQRPPDQWKSQDHLLQAPNATPQSPPTVTVEEPSPVNQMSPINQVSPISQFAMDSFDGNPEEYDLFMQTFDLLVHQNDDIPVAMKHALLLKMLTGEAKKMMRSTTLTSDDYTTLRENLDRQFNRERDAQVYYADQLHSLIFDEQDYDKMEKDLNRFCVLANTLKNRGCQVDDPLFIRNFIRKLPEKLMGPVFKKNREKSRTFKEIVDITYNTLAEKRALSDAREEKKKTIGTDEVYALQTNGGKGGKGFKKARPCRLCASAEHKTHQCPKPVAEKREIVLDKKLYIGLKSSTQPQNIQLNSSTFLKVEVHQPSSPPEVQTTPCQSTVASMPQMSLTTKIETPLASIAEHKFPFEESGSDMKEESLQIYVSRHIDPDHTLPFMILHTPDGLPLRALVDSGASRSIVSSQAAKRLKFTPLEQRNLTFSGFISAAHTEKCTFYRVEFRDGDGKCWYTSMASYDKMNIRFTAPHLNQEEKKALQKQQFDLHSIEQLGRYNGEPIDLLLGNNILGNINQEMMTLSTGRLVVRTKLGPIVYPPVAKGALKQSSLEKPVGVTDEKKQIVVHTVDTPDYGSHQQDTRNVSNQKLAKLMEQQWNLEGIGVEPPEVVTDKERLNQEVLEQFKKSATRDEHNRIQVAFPFNGREDQLQDNLPVALKRLESLVKHQSPEIRSSYDEIIQTQKKSGIIEEVSPEEKPIGPVYHIPHDVVVKEDSNNTKLRIVLDASSHAKGQLSLNDCIHSGPSILQKIPGIMMRSRLQEFLMIADIEKAFHQVQIQPQFRDVTRFLWLKDPTKGVTRDNIVIYRFTRLPFGVNCSPFLLAVTILLHLDINPKAINKRIIENLYVDNVLVTTNTVKELKKSYDELKSTFDGMQMNLREFLCNSKEVMETIPIKDRAPNNWNKLLGHIWDSITDTITIKLAVPPAGRPTKREIVAFLAKNYDPTGMISPLVVKTKKLVTLLWEHEMKWNDQLPMELMPMWNEIVAQFTESSIVLPRQVVASYDYKEVELVMFSDASQDHYGAAGYLRFTHRDNTYSSKLIFSKSRVRPKRVGMTIPQMELLALEIATVIAIMLQQELHLPIKKITFFSDSTCVLHWVIHKLHDLQISTELRYVPTNANPADIATRGCSVEELRVNSLWNDGPSFIQKDRSQWPKMIDVSPADPRQFHVFVVTDDAVSRTEKDYCPAKINDNRTTQIATGTNKEEDIVQSIVPYSRTNDMKKLIHVMKWVGQFVHACVTKRNIRFPERKYSYSTQSMKRYAEADGRNDEVEKWKVVRDIIIVEHYRDSADRLQLAPPATFKPVVTETGLYRHARPFVNSKHPSHTEDMKMPIIIISKHPLAQLIVRESHVRLRHQGVKDVISDVQTKYWMEKIGSIVRKVRKECVTCQRLHARPYKYPYTEALPAVRSQLVAPFAFVGLDYFGPLRYKSNDISGKVWVLLVTCLVTRAVHLEIVQDNSTNSFIMALKRYFGRRGVPQSIMSDNAPSFKLGYSMMNADLKTLVNKSMTLTSFLADREIDIRLITPLSPWKGGIYERIVALVKNMLYKIIGRITISYLELESLVIEAEGILNSRPITANKIHIADAEPIRPIDYLIPKASLAVPEQKEAVVDQVVAGATEKVTRKLMESITAVRANLWNIFAHEYYALLRESPIKKAAYAKASPTPGTTVLIVTDKVARYHWPILVIQDLVHSKDGAVRAVKVKIGKKVLERSVNHLIPLELPAEESQDSDLDKSHAAGTQEAETGTQEPETSPQPHATPSPTITKKSRARPYLQRKAKKNQHERHPTGEEEPKGGTRIAGSSTTGGAVGFAVTRRGLDAFRKKSNRRRYSWSFLSSINRYSLCLSS